ncbi:MAG: DUF6482 family protein [Gammaproteobacteria bacterium]
MIPADIAISTAPPEACIHSLERSLYIVEIRGPEGSRWLRDGDGKRHIFRDLPAARAAVASLGVARVRLLHRSAYDEMVGLGPAAPNGIDIALARSDG